MDYKIDLQCEDCGNKVMNSDVTDTPLAKSMVYSTMDVGLGCVGFHTLTGMDGFVLPNLGEPFTRIQETALNVRDRKREAERQKGKRMLVKDASSDYDPGAF